MVSETRAAGPTSRRFLRVEPLDTLFFRDARPFPPKSQAASGLPKPQTTAGALRSAMLRLAGIDIAKVSAEVRGGATFREAARVAGGEVGNAIGSVRFGGPWFGRDGAALLPAPATLRRVGDEDGPILRLDPLRSDLPGWTPPEDGMKPLWRQGRHHPQPIRGYLAPEEMTRFLEGGIPERIVAASDLYGYDDRTGIAVDAGGNTAAEGMIYATRLLALRPGVCLYASLSGPDAALDLFPEAGRLIALGGEGRRASVTPEAEAPGFPRAGGGAGDGRLLVLTTPALLGGWRPKGMAPVAAAVAGHEAVSGWDLARGGPRPNRFAVPAGSAYFLPPDGVRPPTGSLGEPADTALGWGSYLEGTWRYA